MSDELPIQMQPLPAFGGRSMMEVFAGAAAGQADDHVRMCEITMQAADTGAMPLELALGMSEAWAKMALLRGRRDAREHLVNILLKQAIHLGPTQPERSLDVLAEAVSYLDELAGEDNEQAANNLDELLAGYMSAGGSESDRNVMVARAKQLRHWRDQHGVLA